MQEWAWPFLYRNCWLSLLLFLNRALIRPGQTSLVFHLTFMQWLVLPEAPYVVFCCRVGWRSGNKPSALLFRSELPGSVSAVCRSEELSSLRGNGCLFFSHLSSPCLFLKPRVYYGALFSRVSLAGSLQWRSVLRFAVFETDEKGLHRTTSSINMFFQWFKECEFEAGLP